MNTAPERLKAALLERAGMDASPLFPAPNSPAAAASHPLRLNSIDAPSTARFVSAPLPAVNTVLTPLKTEEAGLFPIRNTKYKIDNQTKQAPIHMHH